MLGHDLRAHGADEEQLAQQGRLVLDGGQPEPARHEREHHHGADVLEQVEAVEVPLGVGARERRGGGAVDGEPDRLATALQRLDAEVGPEPRHQPQPASGRRLVAEVPLQRDGGALVGHGDAGGVRAELDGDLALGAGVQDHVGDQLADGQLGVVGPVLVAGEGQHLAHVPAGG